MTLRTVSKSAGEFAVSPVIGATVIAAALFAARAIDQLSPHATLAPFTPFFQAPDSPPLVPVPPAIS